MPNSGVLEAITRLSNLHQRPPTFAELMRATGYQSTSTIGKKLNELEAEGLITRKAGKARTVVLTEKGAKMAKVKRPAFPIYTQGDDFIAEDGTVKHIFYPAPEPTPTQPDATDGNDNTITWRNGNNPSVKDIRKMIRDWHKNHPE